MDGAGRRSRWCTVDMRLGIYMVLFVPAPIALGAGENDFIGSETENLALFCLSERKEVFDPG